MFLDREGLGGRLTVADSACIDPSASIDTSGDVTIAADAVISEDALILTHDHDWCNPRDKGRIRAIPLDIGEGAFIGARAIVLPQVRRIGAHAVVGAGSVVTKDVPDYVTVAGNPARPRRKELSDG